METYMSADKNVIAVVDYAHNKLSFDKLFSSTRKEYPDYDIISIFGCPGKKAVLRARELVERGADAIAFASCIQKGTPIGYPCPFHQKMQELVEKEVGEDIRILEYTHKEQKSAPQMRRVLLLFIFFI